MIVNHIMSNASLVIKFCIKIFLKIRVTMNLRQFVLASSDLSFLLSFSLYWYSSASLSVASTAQSSPQGCCPLTVV